jgi:hypothetical protein
MVVEELYFAATRKFKPLKGGRRFLGVHVVRMNVSIFPNITKLGVVDERVLF